MRLFASLLATCTLLSAVAAQRASSQAVPLSADLRALVNTPAVSGYEQHASDEVFNALHGMQARRDAMGNITVTLGSGAPHRLIVASLDEPGYVVSRIEPDGYLRVQSLPQSGLPPHYHEMQNAQPMVVETRDRRTVSAIVAGASIHLTPGRRNIPDPDDLDQMYVDLGAKSEAGVHAAGVDVLSPLAAERTLLRVGAHRWAGTSVGDRYGAAVLLELAHTLQGKVIRGSVTIAFVTQQWTGSRGLIRVLEETHPDELIYVGRGRREPRAARSEPAATPSTSPAAAPPLTGVIRYTTSTETPWPELATAAPQTAAAAAFLQRGYGPPAVLPQHTAHLGVPLRYPLTAGEMVDERDLQSLLAALQTYVGVPATPPAPEAPPTPEPYPALPAQPSKAPSNLDLLRTLSLSYGVSEHEVMTRETVAHLLPAWAHPETDPAGNLILRLGHGNGPGTVFMAHTDELGFRVRGINADGTLELDNKGGGSPAFYWGHPALLHTTAGSLGAVVSLPDNFDTAAFHFPADFRVAARLDAGAASADEAAAMGIRVGDTVTIPKHFRTLADGRVSIRSLDDRVGCTALVQAVWQLGASFDRNVTFVWSTQEELGLLGAVAYAGEAAKAGRIPQTVFAIDTFVSSDSPLESHRFADGVLGDGFVIRAIDNSNIVP